MIKSLSLASHNVRTLIKAMMLQVIVLALVVTAVFVAFGDLFYEIVAIAKASDVMGFLSNTLLSITDGTFDSATFTQGLNDVIGKVQSSIENIGDFWGSVELAYVLVVLMFCVYRVVIALTDVSVCCQLEEYMTSNYSRSLMWFFLKKQGKSWKFALFQMAITLPLDILIISGCIGFYLMFLIAFNWWTIIPTLIIALLLYTIRLTLCSHCLPAVVCESNLHTRQAFKIGLQQSIARFWHVFWRTLVVLCLMVGFTVLAILVTDVLWLSALLLAVPNFVLFYYIKCINMVDYFQSNNKPFFYKRVDIEGTDRYNRKHGKAQQK